MKKLLIVLFLAGVGFVVTAIIVSSHRQALLAERERVMMEKDARLEQELKNARAMTPPSSKIYYVTNQAEALAPAKATPAEIIERLLAVHVTPAEQTRTSRQVIYYLEELVNHGSDSLPAITAFLARNQDIDYVFVPQDKQKSPGIRSVPNDFVMPPSMRFGLFDVVRLIGGDDAEKILADVLGNTGRGMELAWLARTLQQIAPDKYREIALAAARDLLSRPPNGSTSILDRIDRDQLFSVLIMYHDAGYLAQAQGQLLTASGEVDRSALKYVESMLGAQAISIAAQGYNDPRITDPKAKEPFARVALDYVGLDPQADALYLKAIGNMDLSPDQRRNLIEDLNQNGFQNPKNLTAQDIQLIQTRINLIEQLAPSATDPVSVKAFAEAYKDLQKMLQKVRAQSQPRPATS